MERCPSCNDVLEIARPQIGDQEAVCRCVHCGTLIIMDSHPAAPAKWPAESMWAHAPVFGQVGIWLN